MSRRRTCIVFSPHPDDETLGCGGTIAILVGQGWSIHIVTLAGHMPPLYSPNMYPRTVAEAKRAHQILGVESSIFLDIPALQLDAQVPGRLNAELSALVERLRPDLVLAPFADRHVDHVATLNSVLVATRPISAGRDIAVLAMYEVISSTHWTVPGLEASFTPTWFVDISSSINMKIAAMAAYESQLQEFPSARSIPALEALACFRGSQIGVEAAEAFQVVRMISKAGTAQLPSNIVAEGR